MSTEDEKPYLRRMRKAIDILLGVPNDRFDMGNWASDGAECRPNLTCGAAACALGWIASNPVSRKEGLKLVKCADDSIYPQYGHHTGFRAGAEYYGITYAEAEQLFASWSYADMVQERTEYGDYMVRPHHVICRFAQLIRRYSHIEI